MKRKSKKNKTSFWDKISGRKRDEDYIDYDEDDDYEDEERSEEDEDWYDDEEEYEGDHKQKPVRQPMDIMELPIDLIENEESLVLCAQVPGFDPKDITVDITRELVSIEIKTVQNYKKEDGDMIYQELYLGGYSRSLMLPTEVDVEESTAEVKDGFLRIEMPKVNKKRQKRVSIRRK